MEKKTRNRLILFLALGIIFLSMAVLGFVLQSQDVPESKWLFILGMTFLLLLLLVAKDKFKNPVWAQVVFAVLLLGLSVYYLIIGVGEQSVRRIIISVLGFTVSVIEFIQLIRGDNKGDTNI
jgi:hypothetical protein